MTELILILQLPQDVSTRYRSVDMTVLAPEPRHFLCKAAKSAAFCGFLPDFLWRALSGGAALETGSLRPNSA